MGLPPPVEVLQIRPAVCDAILAILYRATSRPVVERARLIVDPFAIGEVAGRRTRRGFNDSITSCLASSRGSGERRRDEDVVGETEAVHGRLGERERVEVQAEESNGQDGVDGVRQEPPGGEEGRALVILVFERIQTTHLLFLSLSVGVGVALFSFSWLVSESFRH